MADSKISGLGPAAALTGTELIEVVQSGVNKRTTPNSIAELVVRNATSTVTTTSVTPAVLTSFAYASYGAAEVLIKATSGTARQVTKLLITHDNVTVQATEYGTMMTGARLFTADVDISNANVRLLVTSASATSTKYNSVATLVGE